MEAISMGPDPNFYFQLGMVKISEGMKCMQDLVQWYKDNLTPESAGRVQEIMAYLQSLQRQVVQEIESLAQLGEVPLSSNVNGTYMQCGQEIPPTREQNAYFGPTPNQETEIVMIPNIENTSRAKKRKLKSKVWEDFTKYEKDGKEWAKCKHCKKDFVGSSKSGTTHLSNHLKSCRGLRNPVGVVNKEKEKSLIDPESNGSDLVLKIIKYGLNSVKDDILNVYRREKDKLQGYFCKLSCRFNVTIEKIEGFWFLTSWFIDDSWELKRMIILLGGWEDDDEFEEDQIHESVKSCLEDWNIDKKVCSMVGDAVFNAEWEKVMEDINNWLNERGSFPFIGNFRSNFPFGCGVFGNFFNALDRFDHTCILAKALKIWDYVNFQDAAKNALSKGKAVTVLSVPSNRRRSYDILEWVMGCKEAFCKLGDMDPYFKSINFIGKDWDEATLLYNSWKVFKDLRENLLDSAYKTANVYFRMLRDIMLALVQLGKSDDIYVRYFASEWREHFNRFWNHFNLVLVITVILDPRFKMDIVKQFYKEIYGNNANEYLKKINEVTDIYNKYVGSTNNYIATSESELDRYLNDSKCPPGEAFNILEWWRIESPTYPTLAKFARDVLSIPLTVAMCTPRPLPLAMHDSNGSLLRAVEDTIHRRDLDADFKRALGCTNVWLNFPVIK